MTEAHPQLVRRKECNDAGADAVTLECERISGMGHLGWITCHVAAKAMTALVQAV